MTHLEGFFGVKFHASKELPDLSCSSSFAILHGALEKKVKTMRLLQLLVFLSILLISFCGCEPRGETETLQTVFSLAKNRFVEARAKAPIPAGSTSEVEVRLKQVEDGLALIVAPGEKFQPKEFEALLDQLSWLVDRSGYTTRPAFGEIMSQYRELSFSAHPSASTARIKLLAARTYTLLSQELETTAFRVPRVS